tara:strand:+ start:1335 stop:1649 length:315 start_codon:yes stop_codon:yes gene_type:complete
MMKDFKNIVIKEVSKITCDVCGEQATPNDYAYHEFISVNQHCGYGSIHGNGNQLSIDLCQQCFANMCGDNLTVVKHNKDEDIELKKLVVQRENQLEIKVDIDDL